MEQLTTTAKPPIVIEKRLNWANLGEFAHYKKEALQLKAQEALKLIAELPKTIEDIPKAVENLKAVTKIKNETIAERSPVTVRMDAIISSMMQPEKSFIDPLQKYEAAIIKIKKDDETTKEEKKKKDAEIVKCRESLIKLKNTCIAEFNTQILNLVDAAYNHALGDGNITFEGKDEYLKKVLVRINNDSFKIVTPDKSYQLLTDAEYKAICGELLIIDPASFVNSFVEKLNFKFSDYDVAIHNKVQAFENSRIEKENAEKKAAEEKQAADIAATLQSVAVNVVVDVNPVKPLKSSWAIDMDESLESSIIIMTAFVSAITIIKPMLKVNKFNSLTVGQMGTYLCKCKTADEMFGFTGLKFKTIDKL